MSESKCANSDVVLGRRINMVLFMMSRLAQTCLKGTESTEHQAERSVGLSRLLQKSPERLPGTRLTRSTSWKAEKIIPFTALSRKNER